MADKSEFEKIIEAYLNAATLSGSHEETRKNAEASKGLEEMISSETGESPGFYDENSQALKQAKSSEDLKKYYGSRLSTHVRANLAEIMGSVPTEKAVKVVAFSLEHKEDSELGKLLSQYQMYHILTSEPEKNQNEEVYEKAKEAASRTLTSNLQGIIELRIFKKTGDAEKAKLWAAYLAPYAKTQNDARYISRIVSEEKQRIEDEIKGRSKELADYVAKFSDDEVANVGIGIYHIGKKKKE